MENEIRKARKEAGLTQMELCAITGVPLRTLQAWEGNKRTPADYITRWVLRDIEEFKNRE